jgi:DNA-binding XRE family transcriptional regulator
MCPIAARSAVRAVIQASDLLERADKLLVGSRPMRSSSDPDLAPTLTAMSVFSRENSRRQRYLQLVAKTLYTAESIFHAPPASDRDNFIGGVMYSSQQQISSPEVVELRKEAGLWLKELRERRGLSQRQMAEKVGVNYYTFISQLESGRGRIPPDRYLVWAEVLGVEPKFFVRNLLRSYDPVTYSVLFGKSKPQK